MAVFFMYYFMRREFDGVVDGVIYATFAALGFAACENILYYSRAYMSELAHPHQASGALISTFVMRGILKPWGHPLYTALTGWVSASRETNKTWLVPRAHRRLHGWRVPPPAEPERHARRVDTVRSLLFLIAFSAPARDPPEGKDHPRPPQRRGVRAT
jgi:RsiW-degrading membrane proteinase PrsW (M82 family)